MLKGATVLELAHRKADALRLTPSGRHRDGRRYYKGFRRVAVWVPAPLSAIRARGPMETRWSPAETSPTLWRVVSKNRDYALATWNEIVAVVWRHETTVEAVRQLDAAVAELARSHPKGIGMLTIVAEGAPLPPSPARKAIAELLTARTAFIRCSVVIMEGTGFRAAAVRSVVTSLTMLSKHDFPHEICDVEGAVRMYTDVLPRATGRALDPNTVRAAINLLRRQMLP